MSNEAAVIGQSRSVSTPNAKRNQTKQTRLSEGECRGKPGHVSTSLSLHKVRTTDGNGGLGTKRMRLLNRKLKTASLESGARAGLSPCSLHGPKQGQRIARSVRDGATHTNRS